MDQIHDPGVNSVAESMYYLYSTKAKHDSHTGQCYALHTTFSVNMERIFEVTLWDGM